MEIKKAPPTTRLSDSDEEATNDLSTGRLPDPAADTHELTHSDFLILVVDDVIDNAVIISLDLQSEGYRVITASNGEEAVRVASVTPPDLILMDLGMPGLDGLGATRKIRENERLREIPVIAITAFSTDGFRRAAYDAGFNGYLTKPLDFNRLHKLIHGLLPTK
jgi:CheY-like chemotaxis protein